MKIITIGREFGSGGRELGKRLADALGVPCYDKEILNEVAKLQGITPEYVEHITESDIRTIYSSTIGRTFFSPVYYNDNAVQVLVSQQKIIRKLALQGDGIFVGRSADVILEDLHPLNIFVYADRQSKLDRCLNRAENGENEKEILKKMQRIDKDRAANRRFITGSEWGSKESYHLMINTSGQKIKDLVPVVAAYAELWFGKKER